LQFRSMMLRQMAGGSIPPASISVSDCF